MKRVLHRAKSSFCSILWAICVAACGHHPQAQDAHTSIASRITYVVTPSAQHSEHIDSATLSPNNALRMHFSLTDEREPLSATLVVRVLGSSAPVTLRAWPRAPFSMGLVRSALDEQAYAPDEVRELRFDVTSQVRAARMDHVREITLWVDADGEVQVAPPGAVSRDERPRLEVLAL